MVARSADPGGDRSGETGKWVAIEGAGELRGDGPHAVSAGGVDLVLLRVGGGLRAYQGRCPHQGALLGEGEIEGSTLVCRNHRWRFDVETGKRQGGDQCLRACPVRQEGGAVLVDTTALTRAEAAPASPLRTLKDLPGPRGLPFVGNALQLEAGRNHINMEDWAAEYGPLYTFRFGPLTALVVSDPELAEPLYRARPDTYRRPSRIELIFQELGLAGVFSAEGEAWRAQRRLAMEALSQRNLRGFYPTLERVTRRLLRRWGEAADTGRELDVSDELKRFTIDVTTLLVFGHDLNTLEKGSEDVIQRRLEYLFPAIERRLNSVVAYWRYFRLPQDRRVDGAVRDIYAWLSSIIDQARATLASDPSRAAKPANFIEAMLAARDAEGKPFSNDVIFGNGLTMLLAGEDTTAYTLAWAMHHICDCASAADGLRREADEILGDAPVPADIDRASRLTYALAVANEAMRLRPIAPTAPFEPVRDVVIGDVAVPKSTTIFALSRAATRDAARFDSPMEFMPERWTRAEVEGKPHDAAVHVPFGSGPRMCPGRALALLEMRIVLATVYRHFDVQRVGASADVREVLAFTMAPAGLRVKLRRRQAPSAT
jgi:cytochrome P450/nitrite reductase/ring-hydroxylating ferredoxin subunit